MNPLSGDLAAYRFHIEACLSWECSECDAHRPAPTDEAADAEAPYGAWQERHARAAMRAGWYVPPLTAEGALASLLALCPDCAKARHLSIQSVPE